MQAVTDEENWCGVLQEVALPGTGGDPEAFLGAAVRIANERCWGTLSCCLMVSAHSKHVHCAHGFPRPFCWYGCVASVTGCDRLRTSLAAL